MHYTYFHIKNYKGIREARLDLGPSSGVYTLVGLNESGKTTILEAINSLAASESTDPSGNSAATDPRDLIPLRDSADFDGSIEVLAGVELDSDDQRTLAALIGRVKTTKIEIPSKCVVGRRWDFKNGTLVASHKGYAIIEARRVTAAVSQLLRAEEVNKIAVEIFRRLPRILYFPNFLVDIPEKIYIEPKVALPNGTGAVHRYYRTLMADVFRAENLDLQGSVLERMGIDDEGTKRQLGASLRRAEANMTRAIIKGWEILRRENAPGNVVIQQDIDDVGKYLQIRIQKGVDEYKISERSLGFRWYFAYVLLTHYRLSRTEERGVVYLFDEPASNLHPAAQRRLLTSVANLRRGGGTVIYTTHSLHMINPEWLEGAYVVRNRGLSYDGDGAEDDPKETNIELTKYRDYIGQGEASATHIQPILDALEYQPSLVELRPAAILVEGKNDYYTLAYMAYVLGLGKLNIVPGTGAGTLDAVVRLYIGWQWPFVVLHDNDDKGREQHERMREAFDMVPERRFALLHDVANDATVKGMESLIEEADRLYIQGAAGKANNRYNKKAFNVAVRELLVSEDVVTVSPETTRRFTALFENLLRLTGAEDDGANPPTPRRAARRKAVAT